MRSHFINLEPRQKMINPLELKRQIDAILVVLRREGYQCRKQHRRLAYKLLKEGQADYMVEWLPPPVASWSVIPNNNSTISIELQQLIEEALKPLPPAPPQSVAEDYSRPWAIVRLLPDARHYTVARFFNRQDAHDHKRYLNRFMPMAEFEVVFDVPNQVQNR
jgi:hypothetical protein